MSNPSKDFGSIAQEEDISDSENRGTKSKNSDASEDPPQLSVKLPRMSDIQVPTKFRNHARLPVDILLLTVKDCEFSACYMHLNNPFRCWFDGVGFVYLEDENKGQEEKVKVALLRCHEGSGGPGGSIVTTKNAVSMLMPKAVILVGTCCSLRPEETKLGDVVISAKLTTYGLKVVTNERELHNNIRTFASKRFLDLIKDAALGWEAPLKNSEDREVKIHSSGEMLSIPEVINAEWRRKQLAETFPQAVAIDSEAEGLYTAAFDLQVEWLVVKGIANYADGSVKTNENWSKFASANAASLVSKILNDAVVFQRWPHYQGNDDHVNKGVRPSLSLPSLPAMVSNFTGRQSECEEITGHVTSKSTRLVSIWGSPGFGKTSIAIAVGHDLQSKGMPVCWLSLRELKSKTDLVSKLLSFVKPSVRNDHPSFSHPSLEDQLCLLLSEISDRSIFILDNADNLLEDGEPGVKKEVIELLKEILRRSEATIFALTTRESLGFLNVDLQGHQSVRIRPLDEDSAKTLVKALLPTATSSDCTRILQICGFVPFAIKLLCSSISEGGAQPSQYLDEFIQFASTASIAEMLDRPDYPDEYRLQSLFELSFERLTAQEKKALVSLSILPENFGTEVAAVVLDEKNLQAKKLLHGLRRKSLLDIDMKQQVFTMHKLLQSFAREKGGNEMKDTVLKSKDRLNAFYVSLFQKLNEQFLTGHSMMAFLKFYEDEQSIIQSLLNRLANAKTASTVFDVLSKGELFLATLFFNEASTFNKIYDSAIEATKRFEDNESYSRLLVSKAFGEVCWGARGNTVQLLCRAKEAEAEALPSISLSQLQGKRLCYLGINQLVNGNTEDGIRNLQDALQMFDGSPDQKSLTLITLQILAIFSPFQKTSTELNQLPCNAAEDTEQLPLLSLKQGEGRKLSNVTENQRGVIDVSDNPLKLEMIFIVSHTMQNFFDADTKQQFTNILHDMLSEIEREEHISVGVCKFHRQLLSVLDKMEDTTLQCEMRISFHQKALDRCSEKTLSYQVHKEALAAYYEDLAKTYHSLGNFNAALDSYQHALDIRLKLFGEEHVLTANSYHNLRTTQHSLGNFTAAIDSAQHALDIRLKLFGEDHASTADSYHNLADTQHSLGNFNAALDSEQHALDIRLKLFGEEHADTANSYYSLGITQHLLGNFNAALDSAQHALDIRLKLFGEEHADTVDSYYSLGLTQHSLGNFKHH